jgi:molybdenum cofactor cytidylyltransferase
LKRVIAIVPAAGLSRRFGGPNKLLQPYGSSTVIGTTIATLVECDLEVIVVTGRDAEEVAQSWRSPPGGRSGSVQFIFNPNFEQGLGTSVACGVKAAPEADGFLIALGDMPALRPDVVHTVVQGFQSPGSIVTPIYEAEPARRGHPVLFDACYRTELESLTGDEGARSILEKHSGDVIQIPVQGSLRGLDTPES